jgi:methionyl-tRNA formyltransferase
MSELSSAQNLDSWFDQIRMLDAEGYPPAFLRFGKYKISFSRPKRTSSGIIADAKIEVERDSNFSILSP